MGTATGVTRVQPIKKKLKGYDNAESGEIQTFTDDNRHRLPKLSVSVRCRPYKSVVKRTQRVTMRKNNKFKIEEFQLSEELEAVLRKGLIRLSQQRYSFIALLPLFGAAFAHLL